jgi:hypothetical protein
MRHPIVMLGWHDACRVFFHKLMAQYCITLQADPGFDSVDRLAGRAINKDNWDMLQVVNADLDNNNIKENLRYKER